MLSTRKIFIFFLDVFAIIATCRGTGPGLFDQGFDAVCQQSYNAGCQIGSGQYVNGSYNATMGILGGTSGFAEGFITGLNCGFLAKGIMGNTNQGCQCNLTEAGCCSTNTNCESKRSQCGGNAFQTGFDSTFSLACGAGYKIGTGDYVNGVSDTATGAAGAYVAGVYCGNLGFIQCLLTSANIGNITAGLGDAASIIGNTGSGCGNDSPQLGSFQEAYDSFCPYSYDAACKFAQGQIVQSTYTGLVADPLGGTSAALLGYIEGINCGLLASGLVSGASTTKGKAKGGHSGNCKNQCNFTEAQCCDNYRVACGNNQFQVSYNAYYAVFCKSGYEIGNGDYEKGLSDTALGGLGLYAGAFICGPQGLITCLLSPGALNGGNIISGVQGVGSLIGNPFAA